MKETKIFSIEPILTVVTGKLLCEHNMLYEILSHITGDNIYTHEIPVAANFCNIWILANYPNLRIAIDTENMKLLESLISDAKKAKNRKESLVFAINTWFNKLKTDYGLQETYEIEKYHDEWIQFQKKTIT